MRPAAALAAAFAAAAPRAASAYPLSLAACNATDPSQQLRIDAAARTVTSADGAQCTTFVAGAPSLVLAPCAAGSAAQAWTFDAAKGVFEGSPAGACLAWNVQGGDGREGAGSTVSTYTCASLGFNSVFSPTAAGQLRANFTAPGEPAPPPGLCVGLYVPPPPPPPAPPAVGTPDQLAWARGEIACFVHYNMATAAGSQGCGGCGGPPPDIALWNPSALDTDAWVAAGVAMGCTRFVYVAKHGCGFAAWNSSVPGYLYSAAHAPHGGDVVTPFVASCKKAGVGFGFYYSVVSNQYANVCEGAAHPTSGVNQLNVTQDEYNAIVFAHLTELWGTFGPLSEVRERTARGPARKPPCPFPSPPPPPTPPHPAGLVRRRLP